MIISGERLVVPDTAVRVRAVADFTAWVADHDRPLLDSQVAEAPQPGACGASQFDEHHTHRSASDSTGPSRGESVAGVTGLRNVAPMRPTAFASSPDHSLA